MAADDNIKQYLPSDEEIERALKEHMAADSAGAAPAPGSGSFTDVRPDSLVKGRVLAIQGERVLVDLGYKAEGVVDLSEFGATPPNIGDEIEALVLAVEDENGEVSLSVEDAARSRLMNSFDDAVASGAIFTGTVKGAVKGGLMVDVSGMRAFMPAREVDTQFVEDLATWIGREVRVQVIERDPSGERLVVSQRQVLKVERDKQKGVLLESLAVGQSLTGRVARLTDFGAFVDLGGTDGLIFNRDLAWGNVKHAKDVVKVGDEVTVVVLKFDKGTGKISLGLKQSGASPWDDAATRFGVGTRHQAKIKSLLEFGAVAEIVPGIEGLIHVSEMSWQGRIHSPSEVVRIGDLVDVKVIGLDTEKQKISLSIKQAEANPWSDLNGRFPWPTFARGKVTRLTDFGAFIAIEEARLPDTPSYSPVDPAIEGMCHVSEISYEKRYDHPGEALSVGDVVDALILEADEDRRRLKLSIKQVNPDPWWDANEKYPPGTRLTGKVKEFRAFGVFVEIQPGLLGLLHRSQIGGPGSRPQDVLKEGQMVAVKVEEVSEDDRRMGLIMDQAATQFDSD